MSVSGQRIPHPPSTRFDEGLQAPSSKRVKREKNTNDSVNDPTPPDLILSLPQRNTSLKYPENGVVGSEHEAKKQGDVYEEPPQSSTDLENVLPPVRTDRQAIEDYENSRAAEEVGESDFNTRLDQRKWVRGRNSIYVDAFNLALHTVLDEESHLFDVAEQAVFSQWESLSYPAQYLYVRLFLRKTAAWHRIGRLGYHSDIADLDAAVHELRAQRVLPAEKTKLAEHPGESKPPEGAMLSDDAFTFADISSEHINTMEEASSLLSLEELKSLAKDIKVQGKTKKDLLLSIRRTSHAQRGLSWGILKRSDTEDSAKSEDSEATECLAEPGSNRDAHFVRRILSDTTGECIRLTKASQMLFERVHLVFYRSTEWTEKSLTTIILARISRRNFPDYLVARSADIFESRAMLLEFEAAIRTQHRIDNILEFNGPVTDEGRDEIKQLAEAVYPRWQTLLVHEMLKETRVYDTGEGCYLRRFSPAWVYTRVIHKSLDILARYKQHEREYELLIELLDQTLFHPARRGAWYQRKALLEEHYMWKIKQEGGESEDARRRHWRRVALQTCEAGLQDPDCHLIYHYDLQKRLKKLEHALRIPMRQQHEFSHAALAQPVERTIHGTRLQKQQASRRGSATPPPLARRTSSPGPRAPGTRTLWLDVDDSGGAVSVEEFTLTHYRVKEGWKGLHTEGGILRTLFGLLFHDILFAYVPGVFQTAFQTAPLDLSTDAFFSARRQALEHRFAALSNGAAPQLLADAWDLHAERQTCIVGVRWDYERDDLLEIAGCFPGNGLAAICRVLAQEYTQRGGGIPDLFLWRVEVEGKGATDIGADRKPEFLSDKDGKRQDENTVPSRRSEVLFVEVKSENDRLSDTQRLWIHVITGAGVRVEVCHVLANDVQFID